MYKDTGSRKPNVLFLCTGNSCRSQMAEGWARALRSDDANFYSAGIETHGLNPVAVKVMAESGVDISQHQSQSVDELEHIAFDWVFSVCDHAHKTCPDFRRTTQRVAVCFDDPPALAKQAESEEEAINGYRRVRDEIKSFVEQVSLEECTAAS